MSGNIVNLGELVPGLEGKTFVLPRADGTEERYHVPGDLDSETVFEFLKLFEDMVTFEQKIKDLRAQAPQEEDADIAPLISEQTNALRDLTNSIKAKLLAVFQLANPDLKELPFGQATTMTVLGEILEMMGLAAPAELPMPDGAVPPTPNRAARRNTARKTTTSPTRKGSSRKTRQAR